MTGNEVAVRGATALTIADGQDGWTAQQLSTLEQLGLAGAGEGDLAVFFHQAVRTGLDPFAKQLYMIARQERALLPSGEWGNVQKWTIQTGIDGYRLVARRAADRAGLQLTYDDTVWCGPDGNWRDVWLHPTPPLAAKVTVYRGAERFSAVAHWPEYVQTKRDGEPNSMWSKMGRNQLAKCAEALALRKAFPQDLSGIYTDDEMGQADSRAEALAAEEADRAARRAAPARPAPQRPHVVQGERVDAPAAAAAPADDAAPAAAAAAMPTDQPDSTGRDCAAWQQTIADLSDLEAARSLWIETGREVLSRDCGGTPLYQRLEARMAELKADADRAAAAAADDSGTDDEGPVDVPEGVGEPLVLDGDGTPDAPLEGEVLDAPAAATPAATPDAEDLRRDTASRRATVTELTRLFAGREAMEAAAEQVFGLALADVSTVRLRKWMADLQRDTATPAA